MPSYSDFFRKQMDNQFYTEGGKLSNRSVSDSVQNANKAARAELRYRSSPKQQPIQKEFKLEPVEKFKLSPEMIKIEKAYKQRDKVMKMLKGGIALKSNELIQMSNALNGVEQQQKMLLKMVPPEQQQVDGMPLPPPDLDINY